MEKEIKSGALYQLGRRIAFLRHQKDMSQLELASTSEKPQSYISLLETGRINATFSTLRIIAIALDVDMEDLFKGVRDW